MLSLKVVNLYKRDNFYFNIENIFLKTKQTIQDMFQITADEFLNFIIVLTFYEAIKVTLTSNYV